MLETLSHPRLPVALEGLRQCRNDAAKIQLFFKPLKKNSPPPRKISTEVMICYRYIPILKNHTFVQLLNGKYQIPIAPPNDIATINIDMV